MHPLKIIVNGNPIETSLSEVHSADVVAFAGKSGNPSVTYREYTVSVSRARRRTISRA